MRPKLKEDPREWLKFAAVLAITGAAVALWSWHKQFVSERALTASLLMLGLALGGVLFRPVLARPAYRFGMTISFYVGQIVGRVLLTIFFVGVLTPLGLCLRLLGKDLLQLKRNARATSYWKHGKISNQFKRLF